MVLPPAAVALPLILMGSNIVPRKAKSLRIVDQTADPHALEFAAIKAADELASGSLVPKRGPSGNIEKLTKFILEGTSFGSNFVFKKAREGVMKQVRTGHAF